MFLKTGNRNKSTISIITFLILFIFLLFFSFKYDRIRWLDKLTYFSNKKLSSIETKTTTIKIDTIVFGKKPDVFIKNISVETKKHLPDSLKPGLKKNIFIDSIYIRKVHFLQFLWTRNITLGSIQLFQPKLSLIQTSLSGHKKQGKKPKINYIQIIQDLLNSIRINEFHVIRSAISYKKNDTLNQNLKISIKSMNISVFGLIHNAESLENIMYPKVKALMVNADSLQMINADSSYQFIAGKLKANSYEKNLFIEKIRVHHLKKTMDYPYEKDLLNFESAGMALQNFHYEVFYKNQDLSVDRIILNTPKIEVHRNKRLPENTTKRPDFPQELLQSINKNIRINQLSIENGYIRYWQIMENSEFPLDIFFNNVNIEAYNIHNDTTKSKKTNPIKISAKASFLDTTSVFLSIVMPLGARSIQYSYTGFIQAMPLTALNKVIEKPLNVRIQKGFIDKLTFSVQSGKHIAKGNMEFKYHDLKIELLKTKTYEKKVKGFINKAEKKVLSFAANTMLIKSSNPEKNKSVRNVNYSERKIPHKGFVNFLWHTVFTGIKKSIGINFENNIQDKAKNQTKKQGNDK